MGWKKRAVEVPDGLHKAVSSRAKELAGGGRGLTRYLWTLAAIGILDMDKKRLRRAATRLREIFEESDGDVSKLYSEGQHVAFIDLVAEIQKGAIAESKKKLQSQARRIRGKQVSKPPRGA